METPIKPCPFCGSEAIIWGKTGMSVTGKIDIKCGNVDCSVMPVSDRLFETREGAINAWNKRADIKQAYEQGYNDAIESAQNMINQALP